MVAKDIYFPLSPTQKATESYPVGKGDACSSVSFTLVILFIYLFSYLFMSGNGTPSTDMLQYSLQNVHFAAIPALCSVFPRFSVGYSSSLLGFSAFSHFCSY